MEEKSKITLEALFSQIDEFQKTINELQDNLKKFREKLVKNKEKHGHDVSKWPTVEDKLDY